MLQGLNEHYSKQKMNIESSQHTLSTKQELNKLLKIAVPISFSQLGHVMVGFIDSVLAGNIGQKELAIATIASSIFFPLLTFILGVSSGITPLAAYQFGKGDIKEMKKLHRHTFYINSFMAVVMYFLMYGIGELIIETYSGQNIHLEAFSYYKIFLLSMLPIVVFQTFKQYAEAVGQSKMASYVTVSCNILNIVLSIWFVKSMGINGIAWATVISRCLMVLAYVILYQLDSKLTPYKIGFADFKHSFHWSVIKQLSKTALPYGFQMLVEAAAFGAAGLMAVKIGLIEGDAHQIALQVASVVYMASTGLGAASTVRIGQELGKSNLDGVKKIVKLALLVMFVYNIFTALSIYVFKLPLSQLFTSDSSIVALSIHLMLFGASFQFFDGLQVACMGILRGFNDVTIPTVFVSIAYWLVALPLGYFMAFRWGLGVDGIWYALVLGLFLVSGVLLWRIKNKLKRLSL